MFVGWWSYLNAMFAVTCRCRETWWITSFIGNNLPNVCPSFVLAICIGCGSTISDISIVGKHFFAIRVSRLIIIWRVTEHVDHYRFALIYGTEEKNMFSSSERFCFTELHSRHRKSQVGALVTNSWSTALNVKFGIVFLSLAARPPIAWNPCSSDGVVAFLTNLNNEQDDS